MYNEVLLTRALKFEITLINLKLVDCQHNMSCLMRIEGKLLNNISKTKLKYLLK